MQKGITFVGQNAADSVNLDVIRALGSTETRVLQPVLQPDCYGAVRTGLID
jgi:hypothetical protein